jgi:hypothetical protein
MQHVESQARRKRRKTMKFQIVIEVDTKDIATDPQISLEQRLVLEHKLRDVAEDYLEDYMDKIDVRSEIRGPVDREKKHPLDLYIYEDMNGNDLVCGVIRTPNHTDESGYTRTFISWHCKSDLIKDYGSVEAFFNHIDGYLVDENGNVSEDEFLEAQRMGVTYTGWVEIPGVPE